MIDYSLTAEEFNNMSADGLREEMEKLKEYAEELELEKERILDELEDAKEEARSLEKDIEDLETAAQDMAENVAEALEEFSKYEAEAGGEWYKRDLKALYENLAGAVGDITSAQPIEVITPIY